MNQKVLVSILIFVCILSGFFGGFIYALIYKPQSLKTVYLPQYSEPINPTDNTFTDLYTYYNEDINNNITGYGEFSVVLFNNRGISFRVLNSEGENVTSSTGLIVDTKGSTPNYTAIKIPYFTNSTDKLKLQYNSGSSGINVIRIDYIKNGGY